MARQLQEQLKASMPLLAKHHLEELTTTIRKFYTSKYNHKNCKYGNLNRGFTEPELQAFFLVIDNDEFKLLFAYQARLGLRIGEVVKINLKDIDFKSRELKFKSEKSRKMDSLIIPIQLFQDTLKYIESYRELIENAESYLFPRDPSYSKRKDCWINQHYVRKKFRYYIRLAGLDETYAESEESNPKRGLRTLHRLTTHSLRHYAITRFAKQSNGNLVLTSRFARHSEPSTTMTYIHTDKKEIYDVIERIGSSLVPISASNGNAGFKE